MAAFRHDVHKDYSVVCRPIAAGEIVPVFPEFGADIVRPGQELHIVIASGSVRIDRRVEAMQAARPGQKLFVRDGDGKIFSARYKERP
jgi:flagella basal body P-ring formation protein FlgA